MIPLRLSVRNFMCYRDNVPALDLEGVHLACLSGLNGHGKTALLDAITWALWGEARARQQEHLVHQGRQSMSVELDFLARDQRYRVSRKYSRSGAQWKTLLELQVITDGGPVPITGNTTTETAAKVSEILHMDYNTFVNTAFLLQGRADSFTTSAAARRKEVLAEVLDLSYYELLADRARERAREVLGRINVTDSDVERRKEDLARKPESEKGQAAVVETLARLEPEAAARRAGVEGLRARVESLETLRAERDAIDRRLAEGSEETVTLTRQVGSAEGRVQAYEEALRAEVDTREKYALLEEARAEQQRLDEVALEAGSLDRERAAVAEEVAVQRERLSARISQLRDRVERDLRPAAESLPEIEKGLEQAAAERAAITGLDEEVRKRNDDAQGLLARMRSLEESKASLKSGMEETRKKFDMLDRDDALCPLCRQPLGPEGRENLRHEYEDEGRRSKSRYREHDEEHGEAHRRHGELAEDVRRRQADLDRRTPEVQSRTAALERDRSEGLKARDEMAPALVELSELDAALAGGRYAEQEQETLGRIDGELAGLAYDGERHRRVRERVLLLAPHQEAHRRLLDAVEKLPAEREALESSRGMLRRRLRDQEQDSGRKEELALQLEALPALRAERSTAESGLGSIEQQLEQARVEQKVIAERLQRFAEVEQELKRLERSRRALLEERAVYDDLTRAFGKNGVQALIIETAIPQLQDDANELLGRLTDSRMSLKLQLQEGRMVKGLPSEELQILIADEIGTRSYETFSGGETFRINFALRIALSKLLARRSGAPLPTLFIDEGFGSQDAAGQERLKEAIQSIQSDFRKIIVITHVEEVKDSFPARIEVTKTNEGSTFVAV